MAGNRKAIRTGMEKTWIMPNPPFMNQNPGTAGGGGADLKEPLAAATGTSTPATNVSNGRISPYHENTNFYGPRQLHLNEGAQIEGLGRTYQNLLHGRCRVEARSIREACKKAAEIWRWRR